MQGIPTGICLPGGEAVVQRLGSAERASVGVHGLCPHTALAIKDCSVADPVGVNRHTNPPQFNKTVTQKTARKDCFLDLWRNFCWATSAPGQPPANDSKCRVLSGVRQAPFLAADLSTAYMMKVTRLATI